MLFFKVSLKELLRSKRQQKELVSDLACFNLNLFQLITKKHCAAISKQVSVKRARNANIVMISALSKKKKPILIFTQIQDPKLVKCRTLSSLASISLKLLKGVCMVSIGCVQIMEMTANIGICCLKATFCRRKSLNKGSLQMKKKN